MKNKGVRSHCLVVDGLLVVHAGVASIQGQGDVPLTRPMFHFRTEESKCSAVGAMYLAEEDCVVQGVLAILVSIKHGEKAGVQSRRSDVSQKTRPRGGGGELRL